MSYTTISEYVTNFLKLYDTIEIDTNHVQDGSDKYGLFKSPSRDFERHADGSALITEYFQFYAFQSSASEYDRLDSDEWLEKFVYWVDDYPLQYEYPELDGRYVTNIEVGGSPTPFETNDRGTMYQITLSITYIREA